jgi:hypothetical protein
MYDTIQFICKSIVVAGVAALCFKAYDAHVYKYTPFTIDGMTGVQPYKVMVDVELCHLSKDCMKMAEALYFEARGEGWVGMKAVANVINNRVKSSKFKNSVVDVVERPYQFSYIKELDKRVVRDKLSHRAALIISQRVLTGEIEDNTIGSTHYVAPNKLKRVPKWVREFQQTVVINNHTFYRG